MECVCKSISKFVVVISQSMDQNTRIMIYSYNHSFEYSWTQVSSRGAMAITGVSLLKIIDYQSIDQMECSVLETKEHER